MPTIHILKCFSKFGIYNFECNRSIYSRLQGVDNFIMWKVFFVKEGNALQYYAVLWRVRSIYRIVGQCQFIL